MISIQTVTQIALERAKECAEEIGLKFLGSVRPIYGTNERGLPAPVSIGTCIFMRVGGEHFLVTAAHVMDNHSASPLYVAAGNSLQAIEGEFWETVAPDDDREKDKLDFAFWRLSSDFVKRINDVVFIDESEVSHNRGTMEGRQFLAMGYPISRNKAIDMRKRHIRAQVWTYQASCFDPDNSSLLRMGFSRELHLFLKYDDREKDYKGGVENAINPRGASGGALIDLGLPGLANLAQDAPCIGRLAGVFIERHRNPKVHAFVKIGIVIEKILASLAEETASISE